MWGTDQDRAFSEVKEELTQPTVQTLYGPDTLTKISADASSFGLGAVLLQRAQDTWKPVAYASRALTGTVKRYAQIEKEALAVTRACEKFSNYILGCKFEIETDHKPLVPILSTKHLDNLPPRVLRFRLRLARFDYSIQHVLGKLLYTADALSRAPTTTSGDHSTQSEEVETFIATVTSTLPASAQRLEAYRKAQAEDTIANECGGTAKKAGQRNAPRIRSSCRTGKPEHRSHCMVIYYSSITA